VGICAEIGADEGREMAPVDGVGGAIDRSGL
jgi:hypothetical protein